METNDEKAERVRAQGRAYYHRNRDAIAVCRRETSKADPERERERCRENYKKHRERILAAKKKHRDANRGELNRRKAETRKGRPRETHYMKRYGVDKEWYAHQLARQGGGCAICRVMETPTSKRFAIDHCHATGSVRGLLCDSCNKGLGLFKDAAPLLTRAVAYLKRYQQEE